MLKFMIKPISGSVRNILLFSVGRAVSLLGTSLYTFAMGLYVLQMTRSGLSFAITLVLGLLPVVIINPIAGALADRIDRRKIVLVADFLSGVLLTGLLILSLTGRLPLPVIYVSTFLLNVLTVLFDIALDSSIPNLVTADHLMRINATGNVIQSVSSILGPAIGGVAFALLDIRVFIFLNALSFFLSTITEWFVDFKLNSAPAPNETADSGRSIFADLLSAYHYMKEQKENSRPFVLLTVLNFSTGLAITVPLPFIINNVLQLNPTCLGIIQGAVPVGAIIGALLIKKIGEKLEYQKLLVIACYCLVPLILLVGIPAILQHIFFADAAYIFYYCPIMLLFGVIISFIDIPLICLLQSKIPDHYRARVLSLGMALAKAASPAALLIAGALLNVVPSYVLPSAGGLLLLLFITMHDYDSKRGKHAKNFVHRIPPE
jgi:MFS family permease